MLLHMSRSTTHGMHTKFKRTKIYLAGRVYYNYAQSYENLHQPIKFLALWYSQNLVGIVLIIKFWLI